MAELGKMLAYFTRLWNERVNAPPKNDLISMLAHNPATRNMGPLEYMGNLVLLIVGGNDTTRNSMTGGLLAMSRYPEEWAKLRANPGLVDSTVSEITHFHRLFSCAMWKATSPPRSLGTLRHFNPNHPCAPRLP